MSRPGAEPRPLLTIAIPTYGRAGYLRQALAVLQPQLRGQDEVELLVSDNASPDETPQVVESFQAQRMAIRYLRNPENIGQLNFLQCFNLARGRYVWIMGDDDVIVPGGLAQVVAYLRGGEFDIVFLPNSAIFGWFDPAQQNSRPRGASVFDSAGGLMRWVHAGFGFLSAGIVNKQAVEAEPHREFAPLAPTHMLQLGWCFTAVNRHRRSLFVHDKLVAATQNNTSGWGPGVVGVQIASIAHEWLESQALSRLVVRGLLEDYLPFFLGAVRSNRSHLSHQPGTAQQLQAAFGGEWRYWVYTWPMLALPGPLAQAWLLCIRVRNRLRRELRWLGSRLGLSSARWQPAPRVGTHALS